MKEDTLMTLLNLINAFKDSAYKEANVNQVILYDLLELNAHPDIDYSCVVVIPDNSLVNEDLVTRQFTIYYIDRLTDTANQEYIHSVGEQVLESLITRVAEAFDIQLAPYSINFFKHKFIDDCAGCYAQVSIATPKETICEIDYE